MIEDFGGRVAGQTSHIGFLDLGVCLRFLRTMSEKNADEDSRQRLPNFVVTVRVLEMVSIICFAFCSRHRCFSREHLGDVADRQGRNSKSQR